MKYVSISFVIWIDWISFVDREYQSLNFMQYDIDTLQSNIYIYIFLMFNKTSFKVLSFDQKKSLIV